MRMLKVVLIGLVTCIVIGAVLLGACKRPEVAPPAKPSLPPAEVAPPAKPPSPPPGVAPEKALGIHTTKATGEQKVIVVLADFPDVKRQYPEKTISDRYLGFEDKYFREASYDQMWLKGYMTKRYVLPYPVSHYKISAVNLEVDPTRVFSLVKDVSDAADNDVKFSEDSYVVIALGATHAEYGMVGLCAFPGMLGWSSESVVTTKSGEVIRNAVIFCENAHLGTYAHDTIHMLGGVIEGKRMTPCLYDHDLQAQYLVADDWLKCLINMGFWDPMSSHFPYNRELPPAGLSSWTKMRLGWIQPSKIAVVSPGQTATVRLDPLVDATASTLVIKIPLTANTFYLLENRQKISSDANCPSSGVLILYADDTVDECRHGKAPVKIMDANPNVPYLNDAAYDIGKNQVYIDSKNNVAIVLLKKVGQSYDILITTPDKAKSASGT